VRTLVAAATGAGHIAIRVLTGFALAAFFLAYAALGLVLLPLVGAALGVLSLPRVIQTLGRDVMRLAVWTGLAVRTALLGWLSLGR
jgi:hypothetical protein